MNIVKNKLTMKKLSSLFIFILISVISIGAQTKEERELLKSLKNEKEIDVILDISRAKIHGYSESDFVYRENLRSDRDWPTLWESEYKPGLIVDFMNALNLQIFDYDHSVKFGNYENAKYQIVLIVSSISEKGDVIMNGYILKHGQKDLLCKLFVSGTGGTFGSKVNLMGDGFKRAGKELARQMNILFKRGRI